MQITKQVKSQTTTVQEERRPAREEEERRRQREEESVWLGRKVRQGSGYHVRASGRCAEHNFGEANHALPETPTRIP